MSCEFGGQLLEGLVAGVMTWLMFLPDLIMATWEVHMGVQVAIEVRGEACGAVGPGWDAEPRSYDDEAGC